MTPAKDEMPDMSFMTAYNAREKQIVKDLGEKMGYGRIMQLCEEIWREVTVKNKTHGAEHTTGPCAFFMVPCPHPVKDAHGHCDICCGSGRITKGVLALTADRHTIAQAIRAAYPYIAYDYDGEEIQKHRGRLEAIDGLQKVLALLEGK